MLTRGFCGYARVSSNYTVWWSVAGKICTQIHTLVASYGGNQTDDRHYQFALPQTFCRGEKIGDFLAISHTLAGSLSLYLSGVLRGSISTHSLKSRNYVWVNVLRFCSFCNPSRMCIQFLLCSTMSLLYCRDSVDERKVKKGVKIGAFI